MKVDGPGKVESAQGSKKSSKTSGASGFRDMVSGGVETAAPSGPTQSIASIDSLLMVQAAEDPTERAARKRMRQRADTILDELEKVRTGMLAGTLTVGHMVDIADVISAHREKIMDPALTAIMDEVDLRAQVELAKMQLTLNARQPAS